MPQEQSHSSTETTTAAWCLAAVIIAMSITAMLSCIVTRSYMAEAWAEQQSEAWIPTGQGTDPADGQQVIAYWPRRTIDEVWYGELMSVTYYHANDGSFDYPKIYGRTKPTHWRHAPEPPRKEQ